MRTQISARDRLIVALDINDCDRALALIDSIGDAASFYKVGLRPLLACGSMLLDELAGRGKEVFLDLKIDDIPETIAGAVSTLTGKAQFLTVFGGPATVAAAIQGRGESRTPRILYVTLLSSANETDLATLFPGYTGTLQSLIEVRAASALEAGADGLIASGESVQSLRAKLGAEPLIVTPGIRPADGTSDDHKRSLTPKKAIESGADYLVVGRPIYDAADPRAAAESIVEEIQSAV